MFRKRPFQVIYFHTGMGAFKTGAAKSLRDAISGKATYIKAFVGLYLGWWQQNMFTGHFITCRSKKKSEWDYRFYSNLVEYFREIQSNPQFCVKIVQALPKEITEVWFQERQKYNYEIPLTMKDLQQPNLVGRSNVSLRLTDNVGGEKLPDSGASGNKYELLGQTLERLELVRVRYESGYSELVPKIVFMLT